MDGMVEESLLATGFDHPDSVSFGVRGVSTAYAGWSGVAYASHSREHSLATDELVTCELTVQALWCFTRQIHQMIEDGQDPSMPEKYGWRSLRAAYSWLTTARAEAALSFAARIGRKPGCIHQSEGWAVSIERCAPRRITCRLPQSWSHLRASSPGGDTGCARHRW
ncbi:hypothetical protein ACWGET_00050 [Streptomyces zaomyceticus]